MNTKQAMQITTNMADRIMNMYLEDLSDEELLVRPVEGANHIAWQLGHLICSDHDLVSAIKPGSMPALRDGFKEKHTDATAKLDAPKAFNTKAEYQTLMREQRAGALAVLNQMNDADLDEPSPEALQKYFKTVGIIMSMALGTHAMMHVGQWAIVRRKLGRPPIV